MSKNIFVTDRNKIINLFKEKKFRKISKFGNSIVDYYVNDLDIWKIVVVSEINLKNYFNAEQYLRKLLAKKNTSEINYLFGNVLKAQNKNNEAINAYTKAISLNKNFSEAYNNLANTQKKINKIKDAINNYKIAIEKKKR